MSLSHGILGFLSYGSMTGYDLSKAFDKSVKFFWYAQASQIYLELNKLEEKKLVTCEYMIQREKPNKKIFSITETGKAEFLKWLSSESNGQGKGIKNAFLMKVFFSGNQTPEKSVQMLKAFSMDCKKYLTEMEKIPQSIEDYGENVSPLQMLYWSFAADFGDSYMKMCMHWADECVAKLEEFL